MKVTTEMVETQERRRESRQAGYLLQEGADVMLMLQLHLLVEIRDLLKNLQTEKGE